MKNNEYSYTYRYVLITKSGKSEPWSGFFYSEKESDIWFNTYGVEWEKQGYNLKFEKKRRLWTNIKQL